MWVDDPHFELSYHLRHTALPPPGAAAELRRLVGRVMAQPLDRRRPLWEMWVIRVRRRPVGAALQASPLHGRWDLRRRPARGAPRSPAGRATLAARPLAAAAPALDGELAHTLSETAAGPAQHLRQVRALLGAPRQTARQAITLAAGLSSLRALVGASTARSLNGPLRAERQWIQARASLADVKTIRRALGERSTTCCSPASAAAFARCCWVAASPTRRADRAHTRAAVAAHT